MKTYIAHKYRLYPNLQQKELLNKTFGCCRFVYNYMLKLYKDVNEYGDDLMFKLPEERTYDSKEQGEHIYMNQYDMSMVLTSIKNDYLFLNEVSSQALQQSFRHLLDGLNRCYKKQNKFPNFKKKKYAESYTETHYEISKIPYNTNIPLNKNFKLDSDYFFIKLNKIGWVRTKGCKRNPLQGKLKSVTVSKDNIGNYYVSILMETEIYKSRQRNSKISIDLGLKHFCTFPDGTKIENPHFLEHALTRLKHEQRLLSRKKKDSKRREKQRLKVAKLHKRVANLRSNFIHQLSSKIVKENQFIYVEDLNVESIRKDYGRSIDDVSWSKFISLLEYKSKLYDCVFIKVSRWFPSSKKCSHCGFINKELKLSDREWICPCCKEHHDRDVNAAKNIFSQGEYLYITKHPLHKEVSSQRYVVAQSLK